MIDWALARRVAVFVSGETPIPMSPPAPPPAASLPGLEGMVERSRGLVSAYAELSVEGELPAPEALTRAEWIDANVRSLRPLLEPMTARVGERLGPLAPAVRPLVGVLVAAEVGLLFGYMARHVLGQYELLVVDPDSPARLLFVAPNLEQTVQSFGADRDQLLTWVALHEVTHALQFAGVPWLRTHMAAMVGELLASVEVSMDSARLLRVPRGDDLRGLVEAVRSGDILTFVVGPSERALIDRLQTVMAVIEGHAEHVMDAVGIELLPSLPQLRAAMQARRMSGSPLARLLSRLLGIELKLRQYEAGKRFCDAVVEADGVGALNRVWSSPETLPSPSELRDPSAWIARTSVPNVTKS